MGFFRSFLGPLDLIGGEFGFNIKGNSRQITCLSCCSSCIIYLICFIVFIKLFSDYFNSENPKITQTFTQTTDNPLIDLYGRHLSYAFLLQDKTGKEITNDELFNYMTPMLQITQVGQ